MKLFQLNKQMQVISLCLVISLLSMPCLADPPPPPPPHSNILPAEKTTKSQKNISTTNSRRKKNGTRTQNRKTIKKNDQRRKSRERLWNKIKSRTPVLTPRPVTPPLPPPLGGGNDGSTRFSPPLPPPASGTGLSWSSSLRTLPPPAPPHLGFSSLKGGTDSNDKDLELYNFNKDDETHEDSSRQRIATYYVPNIRKKGETSVGTNGGQLSNNLADLFERAIYYYDMHDTLPKGSKDKNVGAITKWQNATRDLCSALKPAAKSARDDDKRPLGTVLDQLYAPCQSAFEGKWYRTDYGNAGKFFETIKQYYKVSLPLHDGKMSTPSSFDALSDYAIRKYGYGSGVMKKLDPEHIPFGGIRERLADAIESVNQGTDPDDMYKKMNAHCQETAQKFGSSNNITKKCHDALSTGKYLNYLHWLLRYEQPSAPKSDSPASPECFRKVNDSSDIESGSESISEISSKISDEVTP